MNFRTLLSIIAILVCELCERLTYFSLTANLILFCSTKENLNYDTDVAATISLVFSGICYFIPIFGGLIADSLIGKFHTIWLSLVFYVFGAAILIPSSLPFGNLGVDITLANKRGFFIAGLVFIAIGTGGIKSNVSPFGAQQVSELGPKAVQSFFNWFYWFINVGAMVAFLGVAYIQQNINFFYGFIVILISIVLSIVAFLAAGPTYVKETTKGSALVIATKIVYHGAKRRNETREKNLPSFLHAAKQVNGGNFTDFEVDEVVKLLKIIPIFFCFIIFWIIYSQMSTSFFLQSVRLNLQIGGDTLPAASLNVFDTIIILLVSPLTDKVLYPMYKKYTRKEPPQFGRIGLGFFIVSLAVVVAGVVEIARKHDIDVNGGFNQTVSNNTVLASDYSVFIQVPQYFLVGIGEVFASITGLEFAFSEAPEKMKGIVMGLFLCTSGIGSLLSSVVLNVVNLATAPNKWIPDDINNGHLDYFCFLLAVLMIPNLILFYFVAKWYEKSSELSRQYQYKSISEDNVYPVDYNHAGERNVINHSNTSTKSTA